jgi:hypothetical protein
MVIDEDIDVNASVSGSELMQNVGTINVEIYHTTKRKILEMESNKVVGKKEHPVLQIPEALAKGKVLHKVG